MGRVDDILRAFSPRTFWRPPAPKGKRWRNHGSISLINRHTEQPHEHGREIARRLRQKAAR